MIKLTHWITIRSCLKEYMTFLALLAFIALSFAVYFTLVAFIAKHQLDSPHTIPLKNPIENTITIPEDTWDILDNDLEIQYG